MSGLFRRLARQIVGPEPPKARPVAGLPFAQVPRRMDDEGGTEAVASAHNPRSDAGAIASRSALTPAALPGIEHPPRTAPSASPPETRDRHPEPVRAPHRFSRPDAAETPTASRAAATAPNSRLDAHAAEPLHDPAARIATERAHQADTRQGLDAPAHGFPPPLVTPSTDARAEASARASEPAPNLRPERQATRRLDPARQALATETATADATPNEVHVHIGRIEITAVQDSATRKPRRAQTSGPTSLDTYLAHRAREQS